MALKRCTTDAPVSRTVGMTRRIQWTNLEIIRRLRFDACGNTYWQVTVFPVVLNRRKYVAEILCSSEHNCKYFIYEYKEKKTPWRGHKGKRLWPCARKEQHWSSLVHVDEDQRSINVAATIVRFKEAELVDNLPHIVAAMFQSWSLDQKNSEDAAAKKPADPSREWNGDVTELAVERGVQL